MRKEFCEKDDIRITYLEDNVCFEDIKSADSILISNEGKIIDNNFSDDPEKTQKFLEDFHRIYPTVCSFRYIDE